MTLQQYEAIASSTVYDLPVFDWVESASEVDDILAGLEAGQVKDSDNKNS